MKRALIGFGAAAAVVVVSILSPPTAGVAWSEVASAQVERVQFAGEVIRDTELIPCLGKPAAVTQTMYGGVAIVRTTRSTEISGTVHGPLTFTVLDDGGAPSGLTFIGRTTLHIGNHGILTENGDPLGRAELQLTWMVTGTLSNGTQFAFEEIGQLRTDSAGVVTLNLDRAVCRA